MKLNLALGWGTDSSPRLSYRGNAGFRLYGTNASPSSLVARHSPYLVCYLLLFLACAGTLSAVAADMKIEVQLLWGTNDSQSPDPKHKPVAPDVLRKLKELPLKWSNYFEVNRLNFELPAGVGKKEPLSGKCAIEIKNVSHSTIEVSLYGKGEQVSKRVQALPKGEFLVLGGNAPNSTAWLVVLKRIE